ncbi:MAG: GTP-binding protein, partial [Flavobacteriaceae bacterium]|nr:GTP-binding protein [Flavobacteriaceae bacterium]
LFMFIHFGVALAFAIFVTMLYTDLSLNNDHSLSLILTIAMPVVWILFYLLGRWGKKKGHHQMVELDDFMNKILKT